MLKVLYFASLRQQIGMGEEEINNDGIETVEQLIEALIEKSPAHKAAFENRSVLKVAINQDYADFTSPLQKGDEVAFFPPVTGG